MILKEASLKTSVYTLHVKSTTAPEFIDITEHVMDCIDQSGVQSGFAVVFSKHTTAAIVLQENEPLLLKDLANMLERYAPKNGHYYAHNDFDIRTVNMRENEPPNGHAHCQHITLGSSETIPIIDSKPAFGKYQSIFMVELDELTPNPHREIIVQILGV